MLVPLPALHMHCGQGLGVAVCPALGLLVTSCEIDNDLTVYSFNQQEGSPEAQPAAGDAVPAGHLQFSFVACLGPDSRPPLPLIFSEGGGYLAFTDHSGTSSPLLLATDAGQDAVHVIDVVGRTHVGYVAPPGMIPGPWGVAAKGHRVAVSAWRVWSEGDHVVHVFEVRHRPWGRAGSLRWQCTMSQREHIYSHSCILHGAHPPA